MWSIIQAAGWPIWPLIFASVIALALIFERMWSLRQAAVALTKLDGNGLSDADRAFYEGKPAVARFFALTMLPELSARKLIAESIDNSLMDVPEGSF